MFKGHPPSQVNFSQCFILYKKNVVSFARVNNARKCPDCLKQYGAHACSDCLGLTELTHLGEPKCFIKPTFCFLM